MGTLYEVMLGDFHLWLSGECLSLDRVLSLRETSMNLGCGVLSYGKGNHFHPSSFTDGDL